MKQCGNAVHFAGVEGVKGEEKGEEEEEEEEEEEGANVLIVP